MSEPGVTSSLGDTVHILILLFSDARWTFVEFLIPGFIPDAGKQQICPQGLFHTLWNFLLCGNVMKTELGGGECSVITGFVVLGLEPGPGALLSRWARPEL